MDTYSHESYSVQKLKDKAFMSAARGFPKYRILYHEDNKSWVVAECDEMHEVNNDWAYVVTKPKLQQYDDSFLSPETNDMVPKSPVKVLCCVLL